MQAAARNLRTVERFLLAPPLSANFSSAPVAVCDISARGARFQHEKPLETGKKGVLKLPMEGRPSPLALEAVVVSGSQSNNVVFPEGCSFDFVQAISAETNSPQ